MSGVQPRRRASTRARSPFQPGGSSAAAPRSGRAARTASARAEAAAAQPSAGAALLAFAAQAREEEDAEDNSAPVPAPPGPSRGAEYTLGDSIHLVKCAVLWQNSDERPKDCTSIVSATADDHDGNVIWQGVAAIYNSSRSGKRDAKQLCYNFQRLKRLHNNGWKADRGELPAKWQKDAFIAEFNQLKEELIEYEKVGFRATLSVPRRPCEPASATDTTGTQHGVPYRDSIRYSLKVI